MTKAKALQKIKAVKAYMTSGNPIWDVKEIAEAFDMAIEALSASEPERKTGKWITQQFGSFAECSECHELYGIPISLSNFCPNCGAKMEGEQ